MPNYFSYKHLLMISLCVVPAHNAVTTDLAEFSRSYVWWILNVHQDCVREWLEIIWIIAWITADTNVLLVSVRVHHLCFNVQQGVAFHTYTCAIMIQLCWFIRWILHHWDVKGILLKKQTCELASCFNKRLFEIFLVSCVLLVYVLTLN